MGNDKDQGGFFPKYKQPSFTLGMWGKLTPAADNKYALHLVCAAQMGVGVLFLAYPRRSTFQARYGKGAYRAVKAAGILTGTALIGCTALFEYSRIANLTYDPWAQHARADRLKALKEGKKVTWWWGAHDHKPIDMNRYLSERKVLGEMKKKRDAKNNLAAAAEGGFKPMMPFTSAELSFDKLMTKLWTIFFSVNTPPLTRDVVASHFESRGQSYEELVAANKKFRDGILEQVESPLFMAHRPWLFGTVGSMDAAIKEVLGEESNDPVVLEGLYNDIAAQWDGSIMWGIIARDTDVTIRLIPSTGWVEQLEEESESKGK